MALWKPFRGDRTRLDAVEKRDGYVYFCIDDGSLFFDYIDENGELQRKQINAKEAESILGYEIAHDLNHNYEQIPTCAAVVAAVENGFCEKGTDITVKLLGGDLTVNYTDERILLTGNAVKVYDGTFEDSKAISSWAKPSMWWGVYYKLIAGTTKTTISPQDTATRAQIAKILVNYINSTHIN